MKANGRVVAAPNQPAGLGYGRLEPWGVEIGKR